MKIVSKIFRHPLTPTITTIIIIITGLVGTLYNDEIKKIIPFSFSLYEGSIIPYIFWILVIVAGFLFFKRQTEDDAARKEIIDELTNTIRTLPPADFLTNFHKIYKETQNALRDASINEISDKNVLDILIRLNLKALLALTKNFDNDMDQTKYGVNIMLFKEVSEINEEYLSEKRGQIKFLDNGIDLKELKGILELNRELSVSSDTILQETPEPDKKIIEIILPIPKITEIKSEQYQKLLSRVLPGAPIAYVKNELSRFKDTNDIIKWCNEEGDFTQNVKEQINTYFLIDNKEIIRSFISIPLTEYEGKILGVINIHSSSVGLIESDDGVRQFISIIFPFVAIISDLIFRIKKLTIKN